MFSLPRLPWMERPRKEKTISDEDGSVISFLNADGSENLDPQPMAPPVGFKPAPSLAEQIREMVRSEKLAREAAEAGFETFEESDDFDVGDDFDPRTPYEEIFDSQSVAEMRKTKETAEVPVPQPSPAPSAPAAEPAQPATIPPEAKPQGV